MKSYMDYSEEVKKAIENNQPILALESTVITHGLPYPINLETANELEHIARNNGVTPATIAIINGRIKVGVEPDELELLAKNKDMLKASTRDLAYILAHQYSAGTTVAATMFIAAAAGIKVFATGGIGGVHRGEALDISADLIELARTPVAVVCAGAKAILDLPRTLEFLETHHVPVIGYRTDTLPAFYTPRTSHQLHAKVNDVDSLAKMLHIHQAIGLSSGMLIVNPIPEEHAISDEVIEPIIRNAIQKAEQAQVSGKAMTPFLLKEVALVTAGSSIKANIALIKNNVRLGAQLAATVR